FVLIDQHGETIGSYNQNIAGDPVLLYVAPDLFAASARDDLRALDRAAGDPGLAPTHALALTRLPLEQVRDRAAAERLAVRVLGDPAGRMVDTLLYPADGAAPAARLYVLRQDSRIAAVLDGHGR